MAIKKIDSFNKHQNPSTNQNPFDIENYLNVNWDKTQDVINNNADELKTAQNNISEIKQEQITQNTDIENIKKSNEEKAKEIDSLKTELEQTKTNLENYAIHGKSTGEYIHLTDSSETDCRVDVRGNVKQETREGYNELENTLTDKTVEGITVKVNKDKSVTLNGTATANISVEISNNPIVLENKDYTYYLKGKTANFNLFVTKENGETQEIITKTDTNIKKVINLGAVTIKNVKVYFQKGATANNVTIYPMIYKGTEEKNYEQYGAMPSLDYPSKIETVGSNKNVFNDEKVKGLIVTIDNMKKTEYMDISLDNNKYYIARIWFEDGTYATGNNFMLYGYNSSNQNIASIPNDKAKTYTNATEIAKIRIVTNTTGIETYENKKIKGIKIEETDENGIATNYSSYEQGSVKVISTNVNTLDLTKLQTINVTECTVNEKSKNQITLKTTQNEGSSYIRFKMHLKKGIWYIKRKFELIEGKGTAITGKVTAQTLDWKWIFQLEKNIEKVQFELKEDTDFYLAFNMKSSLDTNTEELKIKYYDIMLSNYDVDYAEHKEDSVVPPVQEEMLEGDYLDKVNKKEVHTWKKIILDGVNNKVRQETTSTNGKYRYKYTDKDLKNCSLSEEKAYCTHLPLIGKSKTYDKIVGFTVGNGALFIYTNGDAAVNFNAKLQEENYIFYIPVIESAYEKIDLTTEQIQALEKLDKLKTYKNITNITTDSIAMLDVDYKKDLETLLNQITIESEV